MTTPTKIAVPDHRMQAFDEAGKMTPEFFKILVEVITKLNALLS